MKEGRKNPNNQLVKNHFPGRHENLRGPNPSPQGAAFPLGNNPRGRLYVFADETWHCGGDVGSLRFTLVNPTPSPNVPVPPPRNSRVFHSRPKLKGNQWVFISPGSGRFKLTIIWMLQVAPKIGQGSERKLRVDGSVVRIYTPP